MAALQIAEGLFLEAGGWARLGHSLSKKGLSFLASVKGVIWEKRFPWMMGWGICVWPRVQVSLMGFWLRRVCLGGALYKVGCSL